MSLNIKQIIAASIAAFDSGMSLADALKGRRITKIGDQLLVAQALAKHATAKAIAREGKGREVCAYKSKNGAITFGIMIEENETVEKDGKKTTGIVKKLKTYKNSKVANALRMWFGANLAPKQDNGNAELHGVMKVIMQHAMKIRRLSRQIPASKRGDLRDELAKVYAKYEAFVPKRAANVVAMRKAG